MSRIARDYGYAVDDYRVPALHINGGGTATREEAERESLSATAFALEGDPRDYDPSSEAVTLAVTVAPAA